MKHSVQYFIISILVLFYSNFVYAQYTVPNGGFENWTNAELDSWNSGFQTVLTKSTDVHSGNYALKLVNGEAKGKSAYMVMDKTGDAMPIKLKGFVKYNISPNQRARISVSLGNTSYFESGSSTTFDKAGWVSFTGNSNDQYVPFEIVMDYSLVKSIPNNNGIIKFDKIQISLDAYGPLEAATSFNDRNNTDIKENSFVMFDDFSFEGQITNSGIPKLVGIPYELEAWSFMDSKYLPTGLVLSGANAMANDINRIVTRSTDAHTGNYAMGVDLAGTDKAFGFFTIYDRINTTQTEVSFSVKGEMGEKDSIVVSIGSGVDKIKHVITGKEISNSYETYTFDVSKYPVGSSSFFLISFFKNTSDTYSILFDDLVVNGNSIPTSVRGSSHPNNIVASPNPSTGMFLLRNAGGKELTVCNALGATVAATIYTAGKDINVDLTDSPKGIYFINIMGEGMIKVIKE